MSAALGKLQLGGLLSRAKVFNRAGAAGPLRLALIAGTAITVVGVVIGVSLIRSHEPPASRTARMPTINPLPGGPNTNPNQDRLALRHNQEEAARAANQGQSYTPPLAPSRPMAPPPQVSLPGAIAAPTPVVPPATVHVVEAPTPRPVPRETRPVQQVAQTSSQESRDDQMFRAAVLDLLNGWGGRPSRTDVVLPPPSSHQAGGASEDRATGEVGRGLRGAGNEQLGGASPASTMARTLPPQVLVPGGRGVYAHTVVAVNSDAGGPIILQADSGPIAGDRIIGSFGKAGDGELLVVRVQSLQHNGQSIPVDGIVIAPDTMETAVATSVDQHYISRFVLPAAAAFVQGLGQAIATTSNTQAVLSPFGGASYSTRLNTDQQLGVAAGVAGARIGAALNQAAPRGPTIHLAANAGVGIVFLSNVSIPQR